MLLSPESVAAERLGSLEDADWGWIAACAVDHRLRPLLAHHALAHAWPVPAPLIEDWRANRRRWGFLHLRQQALLQRIAVLLEDNGIDCVVLKGGTLAQMVYDEPALRPRRDLDLLMLPDRALEAQALLEGIGCTPVAWAREDGLTDRHHLAPLKAPGGGFAIEVHHTLAPQEWDGARTLADLLMATSQPMAVGDRTIPGSAPLPLMLSVIAHGTLHHLFDNGPLFLADMARLIERLPPDWRAFEEWCCRLGLERSAALVLALVERHAKAAMPDLDLLRTHRPDPALLEHASVLATQDMVSREQRRYRAAVARGPGIATAARRALMPHPRTLALRAGTGPDDIRRWKAYPGWLGEKGRGYLQARTAPRRRDEATADNTLAAWLRSGRAD
ncbi:nucleotidyltransferase family protein [Alteriqipengyuania sp. 357]